MCKKEKSAGAAWEATQTLHFLVKIAYFRLAMFLFVSKLAFFLLILRSLSGPREIYVAVSKKIEEQGERAPGTRES